MSVNEYYDLTLEILDKTIDSPTPIATTGRIIDGDIELFKHRLELVNTGNSKTDNGVLTLRIPPDGTFVRKEPILVNEEAKDKYLIQAQIRQSDGAGGVRKGKIFRFTIGTPTIQDDVNDGETLKIHLIPTEYRLKEHLTSKQLKFFTPRKSFEKRLTDYNITRGSSEPAVFLAIDQGDPLDDSIQLPNDEGLKQNYDPLAPSKTHELLWDIINRLSLPSVSGGTFQDYYFDFEGSSLVPFAGDLTDGSINIVDVKAEKFGETDSGITLDPLSLTSPVDAERDKTIMSDLIRFKNNIIMEGSVRGGSLPMERTRFNSIWQHANNRPEFNGGTSYFNGTDGVNGISLVKRTDTSPFSGREYIRYFEYIGLNDQSADDPVSFGQGDWNEDFSLIPAYSTNAQYEEFEIVTETAGGDVTFYELLPVQITAISGTGTVTVTTTPAHGLSTGNRVDIQGTINFNAVDVRITSTGANTFTFPDAGNGSPETPSAFDAYVRGTRVHVKGDSAPSVSSPDWQNAFNDIDETQYTPYFSYTPWTSDYNLQLANLSGSPNVLAWDSGTSYNISDEVQDVGIWYVAELPSTNKVPASSFLEWRQISTTVPTWIGAVPDYNFERANFDRIKSDDQFEQISMKAIVRAQRDSSLITTEEIINGARFLITDSSGNGVGTGLNDFSGHDNEVAEWFQPPFTSFSNGEWMFSKPPTANDELVDDLNTAQVWGWDGSNWGVTWSPIPSNGPATSPFHAVSNGDELALNPLTPNITKMGFGLVTGATQIPAQAIRLLFHWDQFFGSALNLSSRGAWWVQHLPMPRSHNVGGRTLGDTYANSTLDSTNLDLDSKGQQGWNNGLDSEDLGRISALTMKVRLSAYDDQGRLNNGYPNMPFKAWAIDIFGRIWYSDFTVRRNGEYSFIRIQFGDNAPQKLHHNRIDELFTLFGFTFSQNFFLKQKQFTGIEFDWRFVKSWGIFWNAPYDDNGLYTGVRDNFVDTLSSWAHQVGSNTIGFYTAGGIPRESFIIDHVTLDIDELGFEKQLYANSDDTKQADARTELGHLTQESDYLNLKGRAVGEKARKRFVNQQWHMMAHGDVRMRLGQLFKITGSRVPEQASNETPWNIITNYVIGDKVSKLGFVWQSIKDGIARIPENNPIFWVNLNESVCSEVKHIIDNDGYTIQVLGVRKFVYN